MIRYSLRREGQDWSGPRTYWETIAALKVKLNNSKGPFRIYRPDAEQLGPPRTQLQVLRIVSEGIKKSAINDIWKIHGQDGAFFGIKIIWVGLPEKTPSFDISGGSPAIQKVARVSAGFDWGVKSAGIAYTRKVSGTNIWSQHSRWPKLGCKGNAIDLYFPLPMPIGNDLPRQRRLVSYLLSHANELGIDMIISERTYWSKEYGFAPRSYGGVAHVGHTHIQMSPYQTGNPC